MKADDAHALFKKEYKADTQVKNSKYNSNEKLPSDSVKHPEYLYWPYDFTFKNRLS